MGVHQFWGRSVPYDLPSTDFRRVLRDVDVSTAIPLVQFILLEAGIREVQQKNCLLLLESFIVRRAFVGDETKEYNKFFVEVIAVLGSESPSTIQTALEQKLLGGAGTTRRWPSDEEIREQVFTREVYSYLKTSVLRLILERLELNSRGNKTENLSIDKDITIEHVLPDKWSDHWPLEGKLIPKEAATYPSMAKDEFIPLVENIRERNRKLQTLGNLTLLNRRANQAAGNYTFEKKKTEYAHSVLLLNRYFDKLNMWDESAILDRGNLMFEKFCKIWPRPS